MNKIGSSVLGEHLGEQAILHQVPPITFTIGLDSFAITNTRSRHEDTDFVTVSLVVGTGTPLSQTRSLGNKNNGNFPLNIFFSNVTISPNESAVLTYTMVNAGHQDPGTVEQLLQKGTTSLATAGATAAAKLAGAAIGSAIGETLGTIAVPIIGSALGALAGYIVGDAFGLLLADCDGPVAAGVHVLTAAQIQGAQASGFGITQTDDNPGVNSADGCGSNSHYTVTWSVK